jgi:hypothetical protein
MGSFSATMLPASLALPLLDLLPFSYSSMGSAENKAISLSRFFSLFYLFIIIFV